MKLIKKKLCHVLGCADLDPIGCCSRCGAHLYEGDFIQNAWRVVYWPASVWWRLKAFIKGKTCDVCGKKYRGGEDYCCSAECFSQWVPF